MYSRLQINVISRIKVKFLKLYSTQISERKIKIPLNLTLNFVQSGEGEKTILCMPGALGSAWTDFKPQIENLPSLLPNHTIIAWDPPGYGKSIPPSRQFGLDFFHKDAECAHQLMCELEKSKYSILGWSDGGVTALTMAGMYSNEIEKLVIWGANASINEEDIAILEKVRDVKKWSPRMREPMENVYGIEGFAKLWADWIDAMFAIYNKKSGDFCNVEVKKIVCPVFIVHGKKDPMISTKHVPYLKSQFPNCKYYEFPEGKHNIHLRYANEFNKIVSEFIKS